VTKIQRIVFELVIGTAGMALLLYSLGWLPVLGLVLMLWANNAGHSRKVRDET
jgi:hypothetical protein